MNASGQATKVLFLGATGYIGGSILAGILKKHPDFQYTAIVRNPKDSQALETIHVRVVQGSNADLDMIEKLATEHDIVVNCADADDAPLASSIVKGLTARTSTKGDGSRASKPIYIHTSGTGVASDDSPGECRDIKVLDDNVEEDIRSIDISRPHREVDLQVMATGEKGSFDTYIIAPSTIYGKGRGPVRIISQQVNNLIRYALKDREVVQIGPGTGEWNNVHVEDLMDLYVLVLDQALKSASTASSNLEKPVSGYSRFFWGSVGTHSWGEVSRGLAVHLYKRGLLDTDQVKSVTIDERPQLKTMANNSRTVANRGFKQLGWKPSRRSLMDSLDEEIELTLSQG